MEFMAEPFIFNGWVFTTHQSLIGSEVELSSAEACSGVHPSPDMFFVNSRVSVMNSEKGFKLEFNPIEALRHCKLEPHDKDLFAVADLDRLRVKLASHWDKSRTSLSNVLGDIKQVVLDHDWTFTTNYSGDTIAEVVALQGDKVHDEFLPRQLLSDERIPILFYDEVIFWEDELHDNGYSKYSIRLRVTEKYWFILALFSLKLDGVADRNIYTRFCHRFGSDHLLREVKVDEKDWVFQHKLAI